MNLQAPQDGTQNTDGIDTFYTNNITLRRWDVTEGDDQVAPKANTSNMLIQDSHFHGGNGVSIGSIGQYLGKYEFIENLTAERITCDGCQHVGYVKTWTGIQKGIPPNGTLIRDQPAAARSVLTECRPLGGGGGVGFARNIGEFLVFAEPLARSRSTTRLYRFGHTLAQFSATSM